MTGLIAGSLALLAAAALSVLYGWIAANQAFLWLSIAASAGTAAMLAVAYSRSKAEIAAAIQRRRTHPPARGAGRAPAAPGDAEVIAVPGVRKYHRPDCRYARVGGAERMTRAVARSRGFDACGICGP